MWGWGRTSAPRGRPAGKSAGPKWSKNTNGPTDRWLGNGSTRPTSKPPRSCARCSITASIISWPPSARVQQLQRRRRGVLDRTDDDAAFDVRDKPQGEDFFSQEGVEGVHVAGAVSYTHLRAHETG